jgi:cell division protein FtsN
MTDTDYPRFEVVFGGNDAYREALVVDAEEFISVKSFKAKGKRLTTFEVETINELEPVRFKEKIEDIESEEDAGESINEITDKEIDKVTDLTLETGNLVEVEISEESEEIEIIESPEIQEEELIQAKPKIKTLKEEKEIKSAKPENIEPKKIAEKPLKEKKEKPAKIMNEKADEETDKKRNIDDINGQLTLF